MAMLPPPPTKPTTALVHSLNISKPSQHSLIHFSHQFPCFSSSSIHLFMPNTIHSCFYYKTPQTLYLNNFHFLLSILLLLNVSAPYNIISTITPSYRDFSVLPMLYIPHSFCAPYLIHILHPLPLATPKTRNNPHPLTLRHFVSHPLNSHLRISSTSL